MTGTSQLERPAEKFAEAAPFSVADPADEAPITLGAATKVPRVAQITRSAVSPTPEPDAGNPVSGLWNGLLAFNLLERSGMAAVTLSSRAERSRADGPLHFSLAALSKVASAPSSAGGDWLDAASVLKRDAVRVRNSSSLGRHASILLTLADALTFTVPTDATLRPGATKVLQRGLSVLTEPFISTQDEKHLIVELLSCGWNIAPAYEGDAPDA